MWLRASQAELINVTLTCTQNDTSSQHLVLRDSQETKGVGATGFRSQRRQLRQFPKLGWNRPVEIIRGNESAQATHTSRQKWKAGSVSFEAVDVLQ